MEQNDRKRNPVALTLLAAALAMAAYGVWRGEGGIILNKAVNLCMQCIGLG